MLTSTCLTKRSLARAVCLSVVASTALLSAPLFAAEKSDSESIVSASAGVPLVTVIDAVAKNTKKRFLLDPRVAGTVNKEGLDLNKISYRELQSLLRLHGFAVVEVGGTYNVIVDANIRHVPLPVIDKESSSIGDDDIVVRMISTGKLEATRLVPLLRPMLPQQAHLAATPDANVLVIVATYGNTKTIEATVRALEKFPPVAKQNVAQVN